MRIRSASNVYHIAIIAIDSTRDKLCEALRLDSSEVRDRCRTVTTPFFPRTLDILIDGEARQFSLVAHFYNPNTFARDLIDERRLDASIFAITSNCDSEIALIGTAANATLAREENMLVHVVTDPSAQPHFEHVNHHFSGLDPNNHFDLRTEDPVQFTQKLCLQLERMRSVRTALSAAYRASVSEESFSAERPGSRTGNPHPAVANLLSILGIHRPTSSATTSVATISRTSSTSDVDDEAAHEETTHEHPEDGFSHR